MKTKKIVKKITHTPRRFQSHQWKRVNVSALIPSLNVFYSPIPTDKLEVSIASPEEDIEVDKECQPLVTSKIR